MDCSQTHSFSLAGTAADCTAGFGRERGEVSECVGDQNIWPFSGGNEQFTGRSDPLLFAHSLTTNTTEIWPRSLSSPSPWDLQGVAGDSSGKWWVQTTARLQPSQYILQTP